MSNEGFNILPLTVDMADIQIIEFLQDDGIGFFVRYMDKIAETMESLTPETYSTSIDVKYFRSYLDIYYFEDICIDNNQRWVNFSTAVNDNPDVLNLIYLMERKSLFVNNITPYMDDYHILHYLVKKEFLDMGIIREKDLINRIHHRKKLKLINFFRSEASRKLALEWLNYYISENNCYRSFVTLSGEQVLNIADKFYEMNELNKQLLDVYFKGITDERRSKFKNELDLDLDVDNSSDMTFLNKLFILTHRLMSICVNPMLRLIKNLEKDLLAIESHINNHNDSDNLDNMFRMRFMKSVVTNLKSVNFNKTLVTKFYTEETVSWLYMGNISPSDKLDDILINFTSFVREPFIQLRFDKQLYSVCRNILSKNNSDESLTESNYIRGEIITLFTAYMPYNEYYLNIWFINDEAFMKERLIELFIDFNDLEHEDAILWSKNE